jgi:hypothetical protein
MREILFGLIGCAALGLVAAAAGCGDTVNEGSGGAGSGTSSSTGGGDWVSCAEACDKFAKAGCGNAADCTANCEQGLAAVPECQTEFKAMFQCFSDNAGPSTGCKPDACDAADDAFDACAAANSCFPTMCDETSDGSCDCGRACNGKAIRAACQPPMPDMTSACTCYLGGVEVGPASACDLEAGCCASYFGDGGP